MFGSIFTAAIPVGAAALLGIGALTCFRRQRYARYDVLDTLYVYGGVVLALASVIVVVHAVSGTFRSLRPLAGL